MRYKPTVGDPTLEDLQRINPDVCAWLTIDDTKIDYPVLQSADNSHYLNKNMRGEYSLGGSIFLDYRNSRDFTDSYSLLYGHHMYGGAMFGEIRDFEGQSFFDDHPVGYLIVPGFCYDLQIFAVLHVDAYSSLLFDVGQNQTAPDKRLAYITANAVQFRDIGVTPSDRLLAMSTCSSATTNGRTVVIARMTVDPASVSAQSEISTER